MEKIIDLKELLKHEIMDLYSAEQQIIEALPTMIDKSNNEALKNALQQHLEITKEHKTRLEEIQELMTEQTDVQSSEQSGEQNAETGSRKGFFSRVFGGGEQKCKGMEGILNEGNKMMSEDMSPEVADAAIIASAQKVEHYEISGYGTAAAYARELNLVDIANKLQQTLKEEYEADDKLTELAVGKVNVEAEFAEGSENGNRRLNARSKTTSKRLVAGSSGVGVGAKSSRNNNNRSTSRSNGKPAAGKSKLSTSGSTNKSSVLKGLSKKTSSSNGRKTMSKTASKKRNESKLKTSTSRKSPAKSSPGMRSKSRTKSKSMQTKGKTSRGR